MRKAFTLVELAIVLVIIGLIIGGVLAGQELVAQGRIRSAISQIDSYVLATHTFRSKYGGLPGDLKASKAASFGFKPRQDYPGRGNGDGMIEGHYNNGWNQGWVIGTGETALYWVDLSMAGLISEQFTTATANTWPSATVEPPNIERYIPKSKIGGNNYVPLWTRSGISAAVYSNPDSKHYFSIVDVYQISVQSIFRARSGLSVMQAYNIDHKMDDGLPKSGKVLAYFMTWGTPGWAPSTGVTFQGATTDAATPGSATTCYDNKNVGGAAHTYSTNQNNGDSINCGISIIAF